MSNSNKLEQDYTYPVDDSEDAIKLTNDNNNNNVQQLQPKSEWEKYLDKLDEARLKKTIELAKQPKYIINGKEYPHKKIKVKHFNELERMRGAFASETNPRKSTEILISVYEKCAYHYLGMSKEEYEDLDDWEEIKLILDACAYRSVKPLPS